MLGNKLEEKLWAEIMSTIIYLTNRAPNKSTTPGYTPYESWMGDKPSFAHLRTLECKAFMLDNKHKDKLAPRTKEAILIGYTLTENTYCLWDVKSR